ncbi:transglutaminase family protein [Stappia sp. F7233]|uniref:Transglutaminase family protein n=1 Tax=Stappia albiluteola TaxID=2758565 RepID=A0A839A8Q6_9HYPH|nr:transglutaminase family protein [Stappia albiluteola]MBA5775960.1 transglutaminase family protein [Stappia albiluteola]
MLLAVNHKTRYVYDRPLAHTIQQLRLTPRDVPGQTVLDWEIEVPGMERAASYADGFGNIVHVVSHQEALSELEIVARGLVQTEDRAGVVGQPACPASDIVFLRFTGLTRANPAIRRLGSLAATSDPLAGCHELMEAIHEKVVYRTGVTQVHASAIDALSAGEGVCQDHAHIFIAAARSVGMPARYVSGYLLLEDGQDSEAHHAWAEVHLPGLGWVGFDVSNRICPTDRYIRLSTGLDSRSAAPIRGVQFGGNEENLQVEVSVSQQAQQQ